MSRMDRLRAFGVFSFLWRFRLFFIGAAGILLLVLPVLFPKNYIMGVLCRILMYATLAGALNSINGYSSNKARLASTTSSARL